MNYKPTHTLVQMGIEMILSPINKMPFTNRIPLEKQSTSLVPIDKLAGEYIRLSFEPCCIACFQTVND